MDFILAGTFGRVLECWDREVREFVAIKIVRGIEKYRDAAKVEINVLREVAKYDRSASRLDSHYRLMDSIMFYLLRV